MCGAPIAVVVGAPFVVSAGGRGCGAADDQLDGECGGFRGAAVEDGEECGHASLAEEFRGEPDGGEFGFDGGGEERSSKPVTERSSGMRRPSVRAAL